MKAMRDAAGLLIVILILLSVRVGPTTGQGTSLIPTAHAATNSAMEESGQAASTGNEPASEAPQLREPESVLCAPSILTFHDAHGAEKLVIVEIEMDREVTEAQAGPGKSRACQIG